MYPTPVPTPDPNQSSPSTLWNQNWNKAWNTGFNNPYSPIGPDVGQPGYSEGYYAGQAEWKKRNNKQVLGDSTTRDTSGGTTNTTNTTTNTSGGTGNTSGSNDYDTTLSKMKSGEIAWDDNLLASLRESAKSAYDTTFEAIKNRLNETRNLARQKIGNAQGSRDYVLNYLKERYPELQRRVEEQRANTLEDLGTQEHDLQNLYEKANAQARRRAESTALQNRKLARAGNRLGSSFYDELVAENQENLGKVMGENDRERISKIATIGTQKTRTNQDFNNTVNDLENEKTVAEKSAMDEYDKTIQEADALDRAGVLDYGTAEAEAAANLQSRLDAIAQWAKGIAFTKMQLDAQYGSNGNDGSVGKALQALRNKASTEKTQNMNTPAVNMSTSWTPATMGAPTQGTTNLANILALANRKKNLNLNDIWGITA